MTRRFLFRPAAAVVAALAGVSLAVPPTAPPKEPGAAPAHGDPNAAKPAAPTDAQQAAARVSIEGGLKATVWAAEPMVSNPVAFAFDEKGVCYVAETNRFGKGVPDTRGFMQWLDDDIGSRSVADRLKMYEKFGYKGYTEYPDQVRRIVDTKGQGVADSASIFAGGFNQLKDGLGAGVLARKGSVYYTCIPSLYEFKAGGEKAAGEPKVLSTGYGTRAQFLGHDLHGLRMGPDGKLYFSIGDRGVNVVDAGGKAVQVFDSGCVLRCDLDGKNLEVVHMGLRNPQELAFDDYGNLFTYDNNSDSGDQARWVQIVEGGDSGWRCGFQYGTLMHHAGVPQGNRGPWNAEQIWHVPSDTSHPPAYVVPALANFGNGPAGLTAYPGLGLSDRYKGHFFAADFTASASNSKIWSLGVKRKGASFEVTDLHPFAQTMVPTDCEFGPDGALYILDWIGGWDMTNKGRIFKVRDEKAMADPRVAEAQKIIASDLTKATTEELVKQLGHAHRQVRQEAQFELVRRKDSAALKSVLSAPANDLALTHAIWGMGQLGDGGAVAGQCQHASPDIRAVALHAMCLVPPRSGNFVPAELLLKDDCLAVRAAAALAYGAHPKSEAQPLFDLLASNNNADAYVRQAAVEGLVRATNDPAKLVAAYAAKPTNVASPAVRLGVVLALRKQRGEQLAQFVADGEPLVQAEAARAICDENITAAMPALAGLSASQSPTDPVLYRVLGANYKLGTPEAASRVARFAATPGATPHLREFALKLLEDWSKPSRRDPITGCRQDLAPRDEAVVRAAVTPVVAGLFNGPDSLRKEAAQATAKLGITEVGPLMLATVKDESLAKEVRVEALLTLEALKAKELAEATSLAVNSPVDLVRAAARVVRIKANPSAGVEELPKLLADPKGAIVEKQLLLGVLGTLPESKVADETLASMLDQQLAGKLPAELKLDAVEAAKERATKPKLKLHAALRDKLKAIDLADRAAVKADALARDRDAIAGGDSERGKLVFLNNSAVYCQRCHMLDGQGGQVGPAMNGIGAKHPRDYLLESIVNPNAKIAEGYQSVIVGTADGKSLSGVLKSRTAKEVTLVTPENKVIVVPVEEIDAEKPDKSAMPDDLHKKLTRRELRDLVEFLATLKK